MPIYLFMQVIFLIILCLTHLEARKITRHCAFSRLICAILCLVHYSIWCAAMEGSEMEMDPDGEGYVETVDDGFEKDQSPEQPDQTSNFLTSKLRVKN